MSRVLLVSPSFHGYWGAIGAALESRDHEVHTHLYDEMSSVMTKVDHKLRYELPERMGRNQRVACDPRSTGRAIEAVAAVRPDVVVVIKGDTLGDAFYEKISNRPRVLWLYDELRRTLWAEREISVAGSVCSYSPLDTQLLLGQGLAARHLPLAFDHRLVPEPTRKRTADVVFIGARYSSREQTLLALAAAGVSVRAYGRDWSRHAWDRARTWEIRRPDLPSSRELGRAVAYDTMAAALATLNVHGDQDGFTMRTFEACGVGAMQFIDRRDVGRLYEDGVELVSYESLEELVALCDRAGADRSWAAEIRTAARARTLREHTFDHRVAVLEQAWT